MVIMWQKNYMFIFCKNIWLHVRVATTKDAVTIALMTSSSCTQKLSYNTTENISSMVLSLFIFTLLATVWTLFHTDHKYNFVLGNTSGEHA